MQMQWNAEKKWQSSLGRQANGISFGIMINVQTLPYRPASSDLRTRFWGSGNFRRFGGTVVESRPME
jgi:hypothetical protein